MTCLRLSPLRCRTQQSGVDDVRTGTAAALGAALAITVALTTSSCGSAGFTDADRGVWCQGFEEGMRLLADIGATGQERSPQAGDFDEWALRFAEVQPPPEIADDVEVVMSLPPDVFDYEGDPDRFAADSQRYEEAGRAVNRFAVDECGIDPALVGSTAG